MESWPTGLTPRQIAARANRARRVGLTAAGRQKLVEAARNNQPWRHSTGPRTARGKARSSANGKRRQKGQVSVRELRGQTADLHEAIQCMAALRRTLAARGA
jgi:hypothetical protein